MYQNSISKKSAIPIASTLDGVLEVVKHFPSYIQDTNKGKGVPLTYHLMPIGEVRKKMKRENVAGNIVHSINDITMKKCLRLVEDSAFLDSELARTEVRCRLINKKCYGVYLHLGPCAATDNRRPADQGCPGGAAKGQSQGRGTLFEAEAAAGRCCAKSTQGR